MGIGAHGRCTRVGGHLGIFGPEVPRVTAAGLRTIAIGHRLLEVKRSPVASFLPALPVAVLLGLVEG
jgi:hypothetical protein